MVDNGECDTNHQNIHVIQGDRGGSKYVDADHIGGNGDHFVHNIEMVMFS